MTNTPKVMHLGQQCCGCGACAAICPNQCLELTPDSEGFLMPRISMDSCVHCGLCEKTCPIFSQVTRYKATLSKWMVAKDADLLRKTSSGGVFGLLANWVIKRDGLVYGAKVQVDNLSVVHARAANMLDLKPLLLSKYVQGVISRDTYRAIEADLLNEKTVLFAGTPCQVDALNSFLKTRSVAKERLYCASLICHGVPSPKLWQAWVKYLEQKVQSTLVDVNFRDKAKGWLDFSVVYRFSDGREIRNHHDEDWYMKAFLLNASLRPACFACPSKPYCSSDIILGDFWGAERLFPNLENKQGVSAVSVCTDKGKLLLGNIIDFAVSEDISFSDILAGNPTVESSVKPFRDRRRFMKELRGKCDIDKMRKKWTFVPSQQSRLKRKIRSLLRRGQMRRKDGQ